MPGILRLLDNHVFEGSLADWTVSREGGAVVTAFEPGHLRANWRDASLQAQVKSFV